jgi:hypothetical protein
MSHVTSLCCGFEGTPPEFWTRLGESEEVERLIGGDITDDDHDDHDDDVASRSRPDNMYKLYLKYDVETLVCIMIPFNYVELFVCASIKR